MQTELCCFGFLKLYYRGYEIASNVVSSTPMCEQMVKQVQMKRTTAQHTNSFNPPSPHPTYAHTRTYTHAHTSEPTVVARPLFPLAFVCINATKIALNVASLTTPPQKTPSTPTRKITKPPKENFKTTNNKQQRSRLSVHKHRTEQRSDRDTRDASVAGREVAIVALCV